MISLEKLGECYKTPPPQNQEYLLDFPELKTPLIRACICIVNFCTAIFFVYSDNIPLNRCRNCVATDTALIATSLGIIEFNTVSIHFNCIYHIIPLECISLSLTWSKPGAPRPAVTDICNFCESYIFLIQKSQRYVSFLVFFAQIRQKWPLQAISEPRQPILTPSQSSVK